MLEQGLTVDDLTFRADYDSLSSNTNGKDKVTLMVYICGADLESRSGMATKDLQEMLNASFGKNLKLIVYTGGASACSGSHSSCRAAGRKPCGRRSSGGRSARSVSGNSRGGREGYRITA